MTLPKHRNPNARNVARAPYNFIPLPDVVVKAVESAEELPDHDRYVDGRYTGHFEVTLTTKTPLYIRGGLSTKKPDNNTPSEFERAEAEKSGNAPANFRQAMKNKPEFFTTHDPDQPIIPGSSLRGMLRNLLEIITYSKTQWVTDKQLFFRTMDDSVVGESYRKRMMENVEAGFLRRHGEAYTIHTTSYVRVHHDKLGGAYALFEGRSPNQTPKWNGKYRQHLPVWITLTPSKKFVDELSLTKQTGSDWHEGRLVITGNMPGRRDGTAGKKKEFVFLLPTHHSQEINVPETIMDRFHDDDQITQWQQKAFPKNKPHDKSRLRNGLLTTNPSGFDEPVFFLREKGKLVFLGRAQMFRLPYQQRPLDLIPPSLRNPNDIDFAEAMFGFMRTQDELKQMNPQPKQGSKGRAYAGRVFVSDGRYQPNQGSPWMSDAPDGIIEPHILASPKPTSFQLYLTQDTPNDRKTLHHYDSNADAGKRVTTLRGFKLYWPQGQKTANDLQTTPKDDRDRQRAFETVNGRLRPKLDSTQHTRMKPVADGKKFTFQVHFENLTAVELGALQWALSVPNCHRLGMGKPLGMGVVQLKEIKLQVNGRTDRYKTLFMNNTTWNAGKPDEKQDFTADFETELLQKLRQQSVPVPASFQQIERIKMLLAMLKWQEQALQAEQKVYMTNLNEFRYRPVLPDPLHLGGVNSSSTSTPSSPAPRQGDGSRSRSPQREPRRDQHQSGRKQDARRPRGRYDEQQTTPPAPPTAVSPPPPRTNQPTAPQIGERVMGKVETIEAGDVYLAPEKENYQEWLLRVKRDQTGGIQYQPGQSRACIVLQLLPEDEIVECKPAPKKR